MPDIFSEMQAIEREYAALRHKAARIVQSGDTRRIPGLHRRIERARASLEALRQVVLQKQAAGRAPARFRRSYAFEMWTESLRSRRIKYV